MNNFWLLIEMKNYLYIIYSRREREIAGGTVGEIGKQRLESEYMILSISVILQNTFNIQEFCELTGNTSHTGNYPILLSIYQIYLINFVQAKLSILRLFLLQCQCDLHIHSGYIKW